jgi:hypothetical protein
MTTETSPRLSAPSIISYLESLRSAISQMDEEERKMWLGM